MGLTFERTLQLLNAPLISQNNDLKLNNVIDNGKSSGSKIESDARDSGDEITDTECTVKILGYNEELERELIRQDEIAQRRKKQHLEAEEKSNQAEKQKIVRHTDKSEQIDIEKQGDIIESVKCETKRDIGELEENTQNEAECVAITEADVKLNTNTEKQGITKETEEQMSSHIRKQGEVVEAHERADNGIDKQGENADAVTKLSIEPKKHGHIDESQPSSPFKTREKQITEVHIEKKTQRAMAIIEPDNTNYENGKASVFDTDDLIIENKVIDSKECNEVENKNDEKVEKIGTEIKTIFNSNQDLTNNTVSHINSNPDTNHDGYANSDIIGCNEQQSSNCDDIAIISNAQTETKMTDIVKSENQSYGMENDPSVEESDVKTNIIHDTKILEESKDNIDLQNQNSEKDNITPIHRCSPFDETDKDVDEQIIDNTCSVSNVQDKLEQDKEELHYPDGHTDQNHEPKPFVETSEISACDNEEQARGISKLHKDIAPNDEENESNSENAKSIKHITNHEVKCFSVNNINKGIDGNVSTIIEPPVLEEHRRKSVTFHPLQDQLDVMCRPYALPVPNKYQLKLLQPQKLPSKCCKKYLIIFSYINNITNYNSYQFYE